MSLTQKELVEGLVAFARSGRLPEVLIEFARYCERQRAMYTGEGLFPLANFWGDHENIAEAAAHYLEESARHDRLPPV